MFISHKTIAGIPWSADIVLNDTHVSDAGIYRCMVNNPPETADPGIGELELSVLGKSVTYCPVQWHFNQYPFYTVIPHPFP